MLCELALKKTSCHAGFFGNALGGEHVDVPKLIFALAKVVHLDQAFVDKRFEAVVEPAGTNAQLLSNLVLGEVWVGLQHAQHPKVGVFLQLRAAAGHVGLAFCA